jgi:hypothetical protein
MAEFRPCWPQEVSIGRLPDFDDTLRCMDGMGWVDGDDLTSDEIRNRPWL